MLFRQFYLESLGHASYFLASEQTGEALVVDVRRDVEAYFDHARSVDARIAWAADTHQHNDYLTGICELPQRGEVALLAAARAQLGYPARPLGDRERFELGELSIEALHTPGHTPEHTALLVTDRARGEAPVMLLSGGALLVGDVARPDLLGGRAEAEAALAQLKGSLRERILTLPDHVMVYPTHVKGSLCAGHIDSRLCSTIGYEKRANRFLAELAAGGDPLYDLDALPGVPPYWPRMRRANLAGPPLVGVPREPPALPPERFTALQREGAIVLDCRSPEAFSAHIPGAVNVGLGPDFATWAGTVLPEGAAVLLVLDDPRELWEACWQLLRIGALLPVGWLAGGMRAWRTRGLALATQPHWSAAELAAHLGDPGLTLLDVRQPAEWREGHIQGARHLTGAELPGRLDELPRGGPLAVICSSGYRSGVAASLLAAHGQPAINVLGGMTAWRQLGLPIAG